MQMKNFVELFKIGNEVANSATWKNRQIIGNAIASLLISALMLANALGYSFNVDHELIKNIGAGIASAITAGNVILTVITSKKVGL